MPPCRRRNRRFSVRCSARLARPSPRRASTSCRKRAMSLAQWQRQKSRCRQSRDGGIDVAVSLDRSSHLHNGDILVWDAATRKAVVTHIQLQEVLVIQYGGLLSQAQEALAQTCFELGHALGNQHWPAVVKGTKVYVPLTVDRKVIPSVINTHPFTSITFHFLPP